MQLSSNDKVIVESLLAAELKIPFDHQTYNKILVPLVFFLSDHDSNLSGDGQWEKNRSGLLKLELLLSNGIQQQNN